MLLAIDVGNTHTVFALCGESVLATWRMATDPHRTEDEYAATLIHLMNQRGFSASDVDGCIIASVVPDALFPLRHYCEKYFAIQPIVVGKDTVDLGMKVLIDQPSELGADRLVNAYAAWEMHHQALIVIDFGTATTFDVVNGTGDYVGGLIAPGVNLSLEALQRAAAKLPSIPIRHPERVVGKNTVSAMQSGIYFGYLGLIEGIVARIKTEMAEPMLVIATGGLSALYADGTTAIDKADETLTMQGLQLIHQCVRARSVE